jgi:hypothetical protein
MKILFLSLLAALTLVAQVPKEHAPGHRPPPLEERVKEKGPRRPKLTDEQKKQRDTIISKYDTNKNGRLEPEERQIMSEADRKTLRSFGPPRPPGPPEPPRKPKKD